MPKPFYAFLTVIITVVLLSTPAQAQNEGSWTGEVIDVACYLDTGATGNANKTCHLSKTKKLASSAVKNGQPMGLLTDDGTLVLLVPEDREHKPFVDLASQVGKKVRVVGKLLERDGVTMLVLNGLG